MGAQFKRWLLLGACAFHAGIHSLAGQIINVKGTYSLHAIQVWGAGEGIVPSPDGKKRIVVQPPRKAATEDENHFVFVEAFGKKYPTTIGRWVNAELAWSPDSKAFFVTYSDGGNIGIYHVKVVYVNPTGLRIVEPVGKTRQLVRPRCFDPEPPNIAAIKWARSDSSRLVIAAEVPAHSNCASMGTFRAFEIGVPEGKVLFTYDQIAAKKLFASDLGDELLESDDECVRVPEKCIPAGLITPRARQR
jgi:hypothetical protein